MAERAQQWAGRSQPGPATPTGLEGQAGGGSQARRLEQMHHEHAPSTRHYQAAEPFVDFGQRLYPVHKLAALVGALRTIGIDGAELLAGSGLVEDHLSRAETRISYHQMVTVFRNGLRLSPDPAIILRAGQSMRITSYGMYGYALMSSPSHEAAMEFAVKYHPITGPVAAMSVVLDSDYVRFFYEPILSQNPEDSLYRACVEFILASHLTLNKDLYGRRFKLDGASVTYATPGHAGSYRSILGCPIAFGQARNEIRFDASWLKRPVVMPHLVTNLQARELCREVLAERDLHWDGCAGRIRRLLVDRPGWFPPMEAMAAHLSMTPRMLHRRLAAEKTTYRSLLGEIRAKLAIEYLRTTEMRNEDIAARLGYSDAANFRHAFTRWTGKRPSDYRR